MSAAASSRTLPHPPNYAWEPQPAAQRVIDGYLEAFLDACPFASQLARAMAERTGTRFGDWVDFIEVPRAEEDLIRGVGFVPSEGAERADGARVFEHHGGLFPLIVLSDARRAQVGVRVDSVSDFLAAWSIAGVEVEGEPYAPLRRACVAREGDSALWVVERHGCRTFTRDRGDARRTLAWLRHFEAFRHRRRDFPEDAQGWAHVRALVGAAAADLGVDGACDAFFYAERDYWQRRNRAGRVQKARQDELGLGWANHDHHTYRSSRVGFSSLVALLEQLGFVCRERFYAGREAGWGAQVLEQPACRIVIFADVDLSEGEITGDFAHAGLAERDHLGTVGLWVGLHGESMLQAGMHHLECQFDHEALREQLKSAGIGQMPPFTQLPYLRQAFTEGERWPVSESRLERLVSRGLVTAAQAEEFRRHGAIGSHLENLERHDGYKGFNQQGVSDIIARTDPRRQAAAVGA